MAAKAKNWPSSGFSALADSMALSMCRLDLAAEVAYLLLGMPCHFVKVHARYYEDYVGFARSYYRGKHFPMYQIIWPSNGGHYPWTPKASAVFKEWQPVLGRP
jgi:hypothetical protein